MIHTADQFRPHELPRQRHGFTLIEVLVTLGIILVLVGLLVLGLRGFMDSTRKSSTRLAMETADSIISEGLSDKKLRERILCQVFNSFYQYQNGSPYSYVEYLIDRRTSTSATPPPPANINSNLQYFVVAPGAVDEASSGNPTTAERYRAPSLRLTQEVVRLAIGTPSAKSLFDGLPSERKAVELIVPGTTNLNQLVVDFQSSNNLSRVETLGDGRRRLVFSPPMLLDAWGNPLLFVPGGIQALKDGQCVEVEPAKQGLIGVYYSSSNQVAWIPNASPPAAPSLPGFPTGPLIRIDPIRAPDNRSFWVSAGPDGDFRTGDDNIYSFEN